MKFHCIQQEGAKKKMRKVELDVAESDEDDDVLPIVKSEKKIKREIEEEDDPASRIGVCGGSISAQGNSKQVSSFHLLQ